MSPTIPESIRSYLADPQVRAGVDALLLRSDKLPPDLEWSEMPAYYRALSAAQRVMADCAMTLDELWDTVWGPAIPPGWTPQRPDDQVAEDGQASPHPKICWEDWTYFRCFVRGRRSVYTGVYFAESGLAVGFGVFKGTGSNAVDRRIEGFERDEDTSIYWQSEPTKLLSDGRLPVDDLASHRELALQAIAMAV